MVLGLVSTKVPQLENLDGLKRRIDAASQYAPLDQLAISPQCGFSSDVVGNLIGEEDQKSGADSALVGIADSDLKLKSEISHFGIFGQRLSPRILAGLWRL